MIIYIYDVYLEEKRERETKKNIIIYSILFRSNNKYCYEKQIFLYLYFFHL